MYTRMGKSTASQVDAPKASELGNIVKPKGEVHSNEIKDDTDEEFEYEEVEEEEYEEIEEEVEEEVEEVVEEVEEDEEEHESKEVEKDHVEHEPKEVEQEHVEHEPEEEFEEEEEELEPEEEVEEDDEELEPVEEVQQEDEHEEYANFSKVNVGGDDNEIKKHAELLAFPRHGSEVYVGNFPPDVTEDEIKRLCESVGEVFEVRMMGRKGSKDSKPYAFVTFGNKNLALKAIKKLNNSDFKGKKIKLSTSQAKNKLFIGDIPRNWTQEDLKKAVEKVGPGVIKVDLMRDPNSDRNRGYGFAEYYNSACAEYAKQKMCNPEFKLDTNAPTVSWADPKGGESSSSSKVKSVYVKNLPKDVTQEQLKKLFERHGDIIKVVLPPLKSGHNNRYGFVHFKERASAMKALKNTERYELNGQQLECSLAKPPADKNESTLSSNAKPSSIMHSYPPVGYNAMPNPYGVMPHGYPQPFVYGAGPPPGAAMVPMILPDGRLAYVVQQPPVVAPPSPPQGIRHVGGQGGGSASRQGSGGGGSRSAGGRGAGFAGRQGGGSAPGQSGKHGSTSDRKQGSGSTGQPGSGSAGRLQGRPGSGSIRSKGSGSQGSRYRPY